MNAFSKEVQDRWRNAEEADRDNREEALEDLKFEALDQWDPRVRAMREEPQPGQSNFAPRPCLTIDTLRPLILQVTGDRFANPTSIKVLPREGGDTKIAEIRSELIRSIELQSQADRAYTMAFKPAVSCGIGNFRIDLDYAYEDAFERDLFIRGIPNPLAVLWDPLAADPTGRDAGYCFVSDQMMRDEFKKRFPKASEVELGEKGRLEEMGWLDAETVRVAEFWRIEERDRTFALMMDGAVRDVTDEPEVKYRDSLFRDQSGNPRIRTSPCKYAVMVMTNGQEELSEPFELKLYRLPIIRVTGQETWVGNKRVRFGLVRPARDSQRLKNYWRSVIAELLMFAPRDQYIAPASAIEGRGADWPGTRVYNDNASAPPIPATQANLQAILTEAQMCAQDLKDTTGIHDASLGIASNETSGIAIQRRQHEGDIATIAYHNNMNSAMQEAGEVLNALIPVVYDTPRTIRTVGADEAVRLIRVNDPQADEHVDLSKGRYDVTISTGPAYMTRRQEAAASMLEASRIAPDILAKAGDLIAKAQDWPGADEIAKRLRPPGVGGEEEEDKTPEQQAAEQQQQQMAQQAIQMEMQGKLAETRRAEAEASKAEAEARKARAEADAAEAGASDQNIKAHGAETQRIKAITAKDFPLPPEAVAILAPIVTQAVMQALASPDILPDPLSPGEAAIISASALDQALNNGGPVMPVEEGIAQ